MKNMLLVLALATLPLSAMALTQDDVNFAQRQCQQKNDPAKCRVAHDMARTYQREQRDKLEYDAAVKAKQPMAGSTNIDVQIGDSYGDNKGPYRWNAGRGKYCYHNSSGSVNRCVN